MKSSHPSTAPSEFQKFDAVLGKILSVSHDELKRREAEWLAGAERSSALQRAKFTRIMPTHGISHPESCNS